MCAIGMALAVAVVVYGRGVLVTADGATWNSVRSDLWYYGWADLVAVCSSSTSTVWLGRGDGTVYRVGHHAGEGRRHRQLLELDDLPHEERRARSGDQRR